MQNNEEAMACILMPYYRTRQEFFEKSINSFIQ